MDWNRDGKVDGRDVVHYHQVINSDSGSSCDGGNTSSGGRGNGYGNRTVSDDERAKAIVILVGLALAYFVLGMMGFR